MGSITYFKKHKPRLATDFVSRLVGSHGVQLQRFLVRMLGRADMAEEVAQDTYLKLHRLCKPEEVQCPQALLFDVATKLAVTRLRRVRTEAAVLATVAVGIAEGDEPADESSRPDRRAVAEEALQQLTKVIEELPPTLRQVFVLRYVRQLSRPQIADQLGISVGAVEQRLTRALAECRKRLAALGIDWLGLD